MSGALLWLSSQPCVAQCTSDWGHGFAFPGLNYPDLPDAVQAAATFDSGDGPKLYIGGAFNTAAGVPASNFASWDGADWQALVADGDINELAVLDDGAGPVLYAGGWFSNIEGVSAQGLARYDGISWSTVGGDLALNGYLPQALAFTLFDDGGGSALYVAGGFDHAGDAAANNIAKWDGKKWIGLGTGLDSFADALAVFDDGSGPALYVGGAFSHAGGVSASRLARWNGTSWAAVGGGIGDALAGVSSLAVYDDGQGPALFVGGSFSTAGAVHANCIAKWNGARWSALASGLTLQGGPGAVASRLVVGSVAGGPERLYVAGQFVKAGPVSANNVASWDGTTWAALDTGFTNEIGYSYGYAPALCLYTSQAVTHLIAAGHFWYGGSTRLNSIGRWDGISWHALGSGFYADRSLPARVSALETYAERGTYDVYAAGSFLV